MPSVFRSPDKILDETDRGNDIQRRYRYQAAYAALISLGLLKTDSEFEEILCEQHEDILVRRKDNTFIGIQVKTRYAGQGPFRFSDPQIMKSLERFVKCERDFPNMFTQYVICANCGFWQRQKDATNLVYCLESIRKNAALGLSPSKTGLSRKIIELSKKTKCSEELVLQTLRKVRTDKWADLERYEIALIDEIANVTNNSDQRYDVLQKAGKKLIEVTLRAASLPHGSPRTSYLALLENPSSEKADIIIQQKRITMNIIQQAIQETLVPVVSLQTLEPINISDLPKRMRKMEIKMAKGGISYQNIDLERDLKYSAETLLTSWMHQYGTKEANQRYQYLSIRVRNECQEVYDLVNVPNRLFGTKMLVDVRERLRHKHSTEICNQYEDCLYEHLMGIAGILTEECKLWWSEKFEIPEEAVL